MSPSGNPVMAYPASEVPPRSAFRVHAFGNTEILRGASAAAAALLEPLRVPVAGPSGREAPSPYFWKATLILVAADGSPGLERTFPDLEDRDPLWVGVAPAAEPVLRGLGKQTPDLWWVPAEDRDAVMETAEAWGARGTGAAVAFHPSGACAWTSSNAAFGQSRGTLRRDLEDGVAKTVAGAFIGGLAFALLEELLGDNLFNKGSVRVERECLEMRPLRLGRAAETGLAAAASAGTAPGEWTAKIRELLGAWRGPAAQAWGGRGR